jgi:hypothetical protein
MSQTNGPMISAVCLSCSHGDAKPGDRMAAYLLPSPHGLKLTTKRRLHVFVLSGEFDDGHRAVMCKFDE